MSKVIKSPVKKWSGTVTLADPLSLPQAIAFQDGLEVAKALREKYGEDDVPVSKLQFSLLHGILDCVEQWDLKGIENPPNPFPATPIKTSLALMNWLINELTALLVEAEPDPNA